MQRVFASASRPFRLAPLPLKSGFLRAVILPSASTSMTASVQSRAAVGMFRSLHRNLSTKAEQEGAVRPEEKAEGAKPEAENQKAQAEAEAEAETEYIEYAGPEPFMAKLSRYIWFAIKMGFFLGITYVVGVAGYNIVVTLLPGGAGANAIMRRATDVLKHDPDMVSYFGENIKTYGEDMNSRTEGRRYYVREHTYTDPLTDVEYHRIKFNLEGDRGKKATVWAEVKNGSYDFRYIIVLNKDQTRVWSVIDHRPPPPALEDRQSRVTSLLQDAGWQFFAGSEVDVRQQREVLGDYWLKVKCVRCDDDKKKCEELGVYATPAWMTERGPQKGFKNLAELEDMVRPLIKKPSFIDSIFNMIGLGDKKENSPSPA